MHTERLKQTVGLQFGYNVAVGAAGNHRSDLWMRLFMLTSWKSKLGTLCEKEKKKEKENECNVWRTHKHTHTANDGTIEMGKTASMSATIIKHNITHIDGNVTKWET